MRHRQQAGVLTVAIAVAIAGCGKTPETGAGAAQLEVAVITTLPRTLAVPIEQVGRLQPRDAVEVRSRVTGFITERLYAEGDRVTAGQLLFRIDPAPFQAELAVAEARLEQAQSRLEQADREAKRLAGLYSQKATSQKEYEDSQTALLTARADVRLHEAQAAKVRLDLSYCEVKAPFDGIAGEAAAAVGALVDSSSNSLLTKVVAVDPIHVSLALSEQEGLLLGKSLQSGEVSIAAGAKPQLRITLADGNVYPTLGEIDFVAPELDAQTGTILLRGVVPNPDLKLKPGLFVRVSITGIERPDAIAVPQRAIIQSAAGASVYIVDASGKVAARPVTLGDWVGGDWIIRSGVAAGERVVTDGVQKVRPGMTVQTVETPTTSPSDGKR